MGQDKRAFVLKSDYCGTICSILILSVLSCSMSAVVSEVLCAAVPMSFFIFGVPGVLLRVLLQFFMS